MKPYYTIPLAFVVYSAFADPSPVLKSKEVPHAPSNQVSEYHIRELPYTMTAGDKKTEFTVSAGISIAVTRNEDGTLRAPGKAVYTTLDEFYTLFAISVRDKNGKDLPVRGYEIYGRATPDTPLSWNDPQDDIDLVRVIKTYDRGTKLSAPVDIIPHDSASLWKFPHGGDFKLYTEGFVIVELPNGTCEKIPIPGLHNGPSFANFTLDNRIGDLFAYYNGVPWILDAGRYATSHPFPKNKYGSLNGVTIDSLGIFRIDTANFSHNFEFSVQESSRSDGTKEVLFALGGRPESLRRKKGDIDIRADREALATPATLFFDQDYEVKQAAIRSGVGRSFLREDLTPYAPDHVSAAPQVTLPITRANTFYLARVAYEDINNDNQYNAGDIPRGLDLLSVNIHNKAPNASLAAGTGFVSGVLATLGACALLPEGCFGAGGATVTLPDLPTPTGSMTSAGGGDLIEQ